jgi:tRNA G18 (ribose-2'-O)-methylase SpoU
MKNVYVALENIRSLYNVGSIIRTCSFFGIQKVFLIGYSGKEMLPNGAFELSTKLQKTALGSDLDVELVLVSSTVEFISICEKQELKIIAIEQHERSGSIYGCSVGSRSVLVFGNEVDGVSDYLINNATDVFEVLRQGIHNSLNVSVCCGLVLGVLLGDSSGQVEAKGR